MTLHDGTVLNLAEGWNTVSFDLELTEYKASVSINGGAAKDIEVNEQFNGYYTHDLGNYITYVTILASSDVYVDELFIESTLDAVLEATEDDKTAANAVVELIKNALETGKAADVAAARAAFEALNQVQKDLVDRNVPTYTTTNANDEGALINYYDALVAAEEALEEDLPNPGITLSLNETIDINFKSPAGMETDGLTAKVWLDGVELDTDRYSVEEDDGRLRVRYGCNSNKMFEEVTVQFFDANGNAMTKARTMSIRSYAETLLGMSSTNAKTRALLIQMLDYGALAQYYKGNDLDNLANSIITPALRAEVEGYSWPESTGTAPATAGDKNGSGFGTTLTLNETIDINFYTDPANLEGGNTVKVMRNGVETTNFTLDTAPDGRARVRYSVKSNQMCDLISVQIVDANGNPVKDARSMSAREYAKILLSGTETNEVEHELLVAMLNYGTLSQLYSDNGTTTDFADRYITDDMRQLLADFWK